MAAGAQRVHLAPTGAVAVAEDLGVLQKLSLAHHLLEAQGVDKAIVGAVGLAGPQRSGGVGNREAQARVMGQQRLDERGLAGARRG